MLELPPAARNEHGRTWYVAQLKKTAITSFKMLNDGKLQSAPYLVWFGIYAMIVFCRWFFPSSLLQMTIIWLVAGILSFVFAWFSTEHHAKPEVVFSGIGVGLAFIWIAACWNLGIDIRVVATGFILASMLGIPYWRELAKIKNPAHTYLTPAVTEPEKPKGEFDNVKFLQPDAEWENSRTATRSGWVQRLDLPTGTSAVDFVSKRQGGMASFLKVGFDEVELVRVGNRNDMVDVFVHNKGNFLAEPSFWPPLKDGKLPRVWDSIPIGLRMTGDIIPVNLSEKHMLIAGESGSGKSNELSKLAAVGVHDPTAMVFGLDGKRLELLPFRHAMNGYCQDNIDHAVAMLKHVQEIINFRYDEMGKMGIRKAHDSNGVFGPIMVIFDELARYIRDGAQETSAQKEFKALIFDIGERGRAAGASLVTSVITPSAKLFDGGDMRALFTYRMALRMGSTQGSTMVLGPGQPDASQIDQEMRGMFYMFEGQNARIGRGFYIPDEHLSRLAETAPPCEDQWGVYMADEVVGELVSGRGELSSTKYVPKELTNSGASRMALELEGGPTLPDGTPFQAEWHETLWQELSEDEFHRASDYFEVTGVGRNPVTLILKAWTQKGWLEPTVEKGVTKWRRKADVDA